MSIELADSCGGRVAAGSCVEPAFVPPSPDRVRRWTLPPSPSTTNWPGRQETKTGIRCNGIHSGDRSLFNIASDGNMPRGREPDQFPQLERTGQADPCIPRTWYRGTGVPGGCGSGNFFSEKSPASAAFVHGPLGPAPIGVSIPTIPANAASRSSTPVKGPAEDSSVLTKNAVIALGFSRKKADRERPAWHITIFDAKRNVSSNKHSVCAVADRTLQS